MKRRRTKLEAFLWPALWAVLLGGILWGAAIYQRGLPPYAEPPLFWGNLPLR